MSTSFMRNSAARRQAAAMRRFCTLAGFILSLLVAPMALADAMRCGSKLVRDGDTQSQVREFCGEPTDIQTRTIVRRPYFDRFGRRIYLGDALEEVPVEIWTYNLGPYKLQRRVRFIDGLVDDIETLGYGYREKGEY
jgi:hypothetical protein